MKARPISEDEIKEINRRVRYEPMTGRFYWKIDIGGNGGMTGDEILNRKCGRGYLRMRICGRSYTLHRIAWLISKSEWPDQIDHIDHNRVNNIISNLRAVNNAQNQRNSKLDKRNTSGVHGVTWSKRYMKWVVQLGHDGRNIYLGRYEDLAEAIEVRLAANERYGFHENHGK